MDFPKVKTINNEDYSWQHFSFVFRKCPGREAHVGMPRLYRRKHCTVVKCQDDTLCQEHIIGRKVAKECLCSTE